MAKRRPRSRGKLKNVYDSFSLLFCIDTIPLKILGFPLARLIFNSELLSSSCDLQSKYEIPAITIIINISCRYMIFEELC